MIDPDQTRDRWLALQEPSAIAELRERCEAAATQERDVEFSWWAYHPRPFPRAMAGETPDRRRSSRDARLALDAEGRPVIQRRREAIAVLYAWEGDRCEILTMGGAPSELVHCAFAGGLLVEEVSADGMSRLDGRPAVHVMRWSYDEAGRPSLALETNESGEHHSWGGPERGPYWKTRAYTFAYAAAGELMSIMCHQGPDADGDDQDAAQAAGAAGFPAQFKVPHPLYDGRTQAVEADLPDPARAYEGIAQPLADAIFAAVGRRRDGLGTLEFVLVASPGSVSKAVVADSTFVDRARAMGYDIREMLDVAWREPRGTVVVDAIDTASPELLKRLRAGGQTLVREDGPHTAVDDLGRELLAVLNARAWRDTAPTFLVLTSERESTAPPPPSPLSHIADIVGRDRVVAFEARVGGDVAQPDPSGDLCPRSRDELGLQLEDAGLTPDEATRLAGDALWGILLEPGGGGVSRLGGAPVLPAGTSWPTADGRPLTHLATIAMNELPDVEGREHLPSGGLLSFFADVSDEAELFEPVHPAGSWGHDLFAVIHTPGGGAADEPSPPGDALVEQRVRPIARLQLRHLGFDYGSELFGIDALAEDAVVALTERVNGATHHQLLGFPWAVQDDPREPGQIVLFHVANDPAIDFHFLDGGDLHFLGSPEDIEAMRWDRLTVWPNSC